MHMVQETVFGVVHQHQQLRFPKDDWPQSSQTTAAPDPAGGSAWHICCVERCCRECDASVPGGSICLSYALYSQAERNTQLPHPECARLVPQLQKKKKHYINMNYDMNTVRWVTNMTQTVPVRLCSCAAAPAKAIWQRAVSSRALPLSIRDPWAKTDSNTSCTSTRACSGIPNISCEERWSISDTPSGQLHSFFIF